MNSSSAIQLHNYHIQYDEDRSYLLQHQHQSQQLIQSKNQSILNPQADQRSLPSHQPGISQYSHTDRVYDQSEQEYSEFTPSHQQNYPQLTDENKEATHAPHTENIVAAAAIEVWKQRFYTNEFSQNNGIQPSQYEICPKPLSHQFRSLSWSYGIFVRKKEPIDSGKKPEIRWYCLASEECIRAKRYYTASVSKSKIAKHLGTCHSLRQDNSQPVNSASEKNLKRKAEAIYDGYPHSDQLQQSQQHLQQHYSNHGNIGIAPVPQDPVQNTKQINNSREIEIRLVYNSIKNLESFASLDCEASKDLFKLLPLHPEYNSRRCQQLILQMYLSRTAEIAQKIEAAIYEWGAIPLVYLSLDLVPTDKPKVSVLNLYASFMTIDGKHQSFLLASKVYTPHVSKLSDVPIVISKWVDSVLLEFRIRKTCVYTIICCSNPELLETRKCLEERYMKASAPPIAEFVLDLLNDVFVPKPPANQTIRIVLLAFIDIIRTCRDKFPSKYSTTFPESLLQSSLTCLSSLLVPFKTANSLSKWLSLFHLLKLSKAMFYDLRYSYMNISHAQTFTMNVDNNTIELEIYLPAIYRISDSFESIVNTCLGQGYSQPLLIHIVDEFVVLREELDLHSSTNSAETINQLREHISAVLFNKFKAIYVNESNSTPLSIYSKNLSSITFAMALYPPTRQLKEIEFFTNIPNNDDIIFRTRRNIWEEIFRALVDLALDPPHSRSYEYSSNRGFSSVQGAVDIDELGIETQRNTEGGVIFKQRIDDWLKKDLPIVYTKKLVHKTALSSSNNPVDEKTQWNTYETSSESEEDQGDKDSDRVIPPFNVHDMRNVQHVASYAGSGLSNAFIHTENNEAYRLQCLDSISKEIENYFDLSSCEGEVEVIVPVNDIGSWWKKQAIKFPHLSRLALLIHGCTSGYPALISRLEYCNVATTFYSLSREDMPYFEMLLFLHASVASPDELVNVPNFEGLQAIPMRFLEHDFDEASILSGATNWEAH